MKHTDRFLAAFRSGSTSARVRQCYGRIVRIRSGCELSLTEEADRRIVMVLGPSALAQLIGKTGYEMLNLIGYQDDYILRKLNEGYQFKLLVFARPQGKIALANWHNTLDGVVAAYPELASIIESNRRELVETDIDEFQRQAGFRFEEIDALGSNDPRFMTVERLLNSDKSALSARRFLYHTVRLSELYAGNGMTITSQGGRGVREYIIRNRAISMLRDRRVIELEVSPPDLSRPDSRSPVGGTKE